MRIRDKIDKKKVSHYLFNDEEIDDDIDDDMDGYCRSGRLYVG